MNRLHIDFLPSRVWVAIWMLAGLGAAVCIGAVSWELWRTRPHRLAVAAEIQLLESQKVELKRTMALATEEAERINPKSGDEKEARLLLHRDWNVPFDIIEGVDLPGARLLSLQIDGLVGQAQLEYELDSLVQGSDVTSALNTVSRDVLAADETFSSGAVSGDFPMDWQLQRLSGSASNAAGQKRVLGLWTGRVQ